MENKGYWLKDAIKLFIKKATKNNALVIVINNIIKSYIKSYPLLKNDRIRADVFLDFYNSIDNIDFELNEKMIMSFIKQKLVWSIKNKMKAEYKDRKNGVWESSYLDTNIDTNIDNISEWEKVENIKSVDNFNETEKNKKVENMILFCLDRLKNEKHKEVIKLIMKGFTKREIIKILNIGSITYTLAKVEIKELIEFNYGKSLSF